MKNLIKGPYRRYLVGWTALAFTLVPQSGGCFDLTGYVVAAGGGLSSGGSVTIESTIGQPVAGTSLGNEEFRMQIGFWAVPAGRLLNISTRLAVQTGDNVLIGGFIITGTQPKKLIVRAIGPSLPVTGGLTNPVLELHDSSGGVIETNDNWIDAANKEEIIASTVAPTNDFEAAILTTLPANMAYTAIVRGVGEGTGVGLVEVYDLDQAASSKLANISTRGFVDTGDHVMIGGIIVGGVDGATSSKVIVRAIGPSLPVPGALQDPILELHAGNGDLIAFNNNWRSDQEQEIIDTTVSPTNDAESAIVQTLTPGNYTAIVRGVGETTGVALVEVYALD